MKQKINIALVDDHILLRTALCGLINHFDNCQVICEAISGADLVQQLNPSRLPDIVLLDLNMPDMDGYQTAIYLRDHFPDIYVLMLTMYDSELTLIRLLQAGVKGFLKKDIHPAELRFAIQSVMQSGYYYSSQTAGKMANMFRNNTRDHFMMQNAMLSEHEIRFLKLACTDMTYKEVARIMGLSPRMIDALRDQLFLKLDVKSRVGMAMVALRNGIVHTAG
jgi:two-component system invasion response regulator UvrY